MTYQPDWLLELQHGSWRGKRFYVNDASVTSQRNTVTHIYPFSDVNWVEDLGAAPQSVRINAFIADIDRLVWQQRRDLRQTCLTATGAGELVHPSLGSQNCTLISCSMSESKDWGGVVSVEFDFVISPPKKATVTASTTTTLTSATKDANGSFGSTFSSISSTLSGGVNQLKELQGTVQGYVSNVQTAVGDATNSLSAVAGLDSVLGGNSTIGRYLNGPVGIINSAFSKIDNTLSVTGRAESGVSLGLSAATSLRTAATTGASNLSSFVSKL